MEALKVQIDLLKTLPWKALESDKERCVLGSIYLLHLTHQETDRPETSETILLPQETLCNRLPTRARRPCIVILTKVYLSAHHPLRRSSLRHVQQAKAGASPFCVTK